MSNPIRPLVAEFFEHLPFAADPFQRQAVDAIARGQSVVVTAPTGAGKTLVAEAAVHLTIGTGLRAFYTTPIKALSNQKYADFCEMYGSERVGLLTGDNVINGDAPLIVMTTEVLRNMIYAESSALDRLALVVLDEVHYLQDRYRGSVWEEIIIHLPEGIPLVNLSATIANPEEFTAWIRARRGDTELVVETHRPVPLESVYLLEDRHRERQVIGFPVFGSGKRPNPQVEKLLKKGRGRRPRFGAPRRLETVEALLRDNLLPAIYFIFSRAGCDQAASFVAGARLDLTTREERAQIRRIVDERTAHVPPEDLAVLGYTSFIGQLEQGVAAHHAGMVPAFKEAVEDVFAAGLIKVVFATETLALGINMPARSVVLERLSKFTGEAHEVLQPGDYTQLTGRAGRRGIDERGTAVVLHQRDIPFDRIAAIAAQGSHPLESSFQPTYNMAVNLVANYQEADAFALLNASFAQFRAESRREQLEQRIADRRADIEGFRAAAECDRGDLWSFLDTAGTAPDHRIGLRDFLQRTQSGDVLRLSGDERDRWVLLARGWGGNPRLLLVSASGEVRKASADDLSTAIAIVGAMELPEPIRTRDRTYVRAVGRMVRDWEPDPEFSVTAFGDETGGDPVASCPDLQDHLRWVRRIERAERELRRTARRLERDDEGIAEQFRSILRLLSGFGYTDGWLLTEHGERLRFIYNELDLLLTECVEQGILDGLTPADLAAVVSMFTFEARRDDIAGDWPNSLVAERGRQVFETAERLNLAERNERLPESRLPDPGFSAVAHAWAAGAGLDDLFDDEGAAGDFVRNCRQLLDLLRQLRDAVPSVRSSASAAIKAIDRGVVAAGGRF
ncbi:MAG: DEAD/DEAH box helicase [Acidimicrobiia bacterium]|nr:DEAD/DEAH box helicase [Acidimicrobiia bacterium]